MSRINILSLGIFFLLQQAITSQAAELQLINYFHGLVGAGNYSHFTLHDEDRIKLEVTTVEGDADLYVCDRQRKCDWSNYYLQSITYGIDEVEVEKTLKRPLSFSVYGHPYYPVTKYIIKKYLIISSNKDYATHDMEANVASELFFADFKNSDDRQNSQRHAENAEQASRNMRNDENNNFNSDLEDLDEDYGSESIVWTILLHLIKFLAELCL